MRTSDKLADRAKGVAHRVRFALAKRGLFITITEPRHQAPQVQRYSDAELVKLHEDAEEIFSHGRNFGFIGSTPDWMMEYLKPDRVNFYYGAVDAARRAGIDVAGKSFLDVGTCTGYMMRIMENAGASSVSGTDFYQDCVDLASVLVPSAKVYRAGIQDLDMVPELYDVVFCTETLEHIVDTETPIPKLLSVVRPGGALFVTVPNGRMDDTPAIESPDGITFHGHVNFWSPESWAAYIGRMSTGLRCSTGLLDVHFVDEGLWAAIYKD